MPELTPAEIAAAVERAAYEIARWHGQKMVVGNETQAARHGFGSYGDSPDHYARAFWRQYTAAAEWHLSIIDRLTARVAELEAALRAAKGYLVNASIDLSTGARKATAVATIEGGVRVIDAALAPPDKPKGEG